jgi:hypothetical protein
MEYEYDLNLTGEHPRATTNFILAFNTEKKNYHLPERGNNNVSIFVYVTARVYNSLFIELLPKLFEISFVIKLRSLGQTLFREEKEGEEFIIIKEKQNFLWINKM